MATTQKLELGVSMSDEQTHNKRDRSTQARRNLLRQVEALGADEFLLDELEIWLADAEQTRRRREQNRNYWNSNHETRTSRTSRTDSAEAIYTKKDTLTKKVSKSSKILIPDNWLPSPTHYGLGEKWGIAATEVDGAADEMRAWSLGNGERRANWDWVFNNWLKRNAERKNRNAPHRQKSKRERYGEFLQSLGSGKILQGALDGVSDAGSGERGRLCQNGRSGVYQLPVRIGQNGSNADGNSNGSPDLFTEHGVYKSVAGEEI